MDESKIILLLAGTVVLGVSAQWIAWWLKLPSILMLLLVGIAAGPGFHLLDPEALLGDLLFPFVSLSVALILFEGGLTLRFSEFKHVGGTVLRLISLGVLVTWIIATVSAYVLVGLSFELSLLLGAILTVTGPTVVGPLLRHIRPVGSAGSILKWEGILVDPVGALLAVLIFQAIDSGRISQAPTVVMLGVFKAVAAGAVVGAAGALVLVVTFRKHLIPDALHNAFTLMLVIASSTAANALHHESGLLAVTLMGIALANQSHVPVRHILEFKENLRVLLISTLFILLAARLRTDEITGLPLAGIGFLLVLIFIARPLSVIASTGGSGLSLRDKVFLSWMAPRGIVAAAVTSVFAFRLSQDPNYTEAAQLVPLVFLVIVGTVAVYGLTGGPLARRLGLAQKNPQGALIVGANPFARAVGQALVDAGHRVLLVDSNYWRVAAARMDGFKVWHGNILAHDAVDELDLAGIGRLLAMTPNDEANSLASLHMGEVFGRQQVYQLPPPQKSSAGKGVEVPADLRGRLLFGEGIDFWEFEKRIERGWSIKSTQLTEQFSFDDYQSQHRGEAVPLFLVAGGKLSVFTVQTPPTPAAGQTLISLAPPPSDEIAATAPAEEPTDAVA